VWLVLFFLAWIPLLAAGNQIAKAIVYRSHLTNGQVNHKYMRNTTLLAVLGVGLLVIAFAWE